MRSSIVPAQITTVEDKVAGNLSLTQLLLLATPVFVSSAIYIILPPNLSASAYKVVLMTLFAVVFGVLAIRIKGKILLLWAIMILRYNLRPRYHVFDKNNAHLRTVDQTTYAAPANSMAEAAIEKLPIRPPALTPAETVFLEEIMANPKANLHFKTDRKGGLSVHINEVE